MGKDDLSPVIIDNGENTEQLCGNYSLYGANKVAQQVKVLITWQAWSPEFDIQEKEGTNSCKAFSAL